MYPSIVIWVVGVLSVLNGTLRMTCITSHMHDKFCVHYRLNVQLRWAKNLFGRVLLILLKSDELPPSHPRCWTFFWGFIQRHMCKRFATTTPNADFVLTWQLVISFLNLHELSLSPRCFPMFFPIKKQQLTLPSIFMWCKFLCYTVRFVRLVRRCGDTNTCNFCST